MNVYQSLITKCLFSVIKVAKKVGKTILAKHIQTRGAYTEGGGLRGQEEIYESYEKIK